jgi:hypothetical protein
VISVSVFLVITLVFAGAPPRERHRIAVVDAVECVRRGMAWAEQAAPEIRPGVTLSIACEFSAK